MNVIWIDNWGCRVREEAWLRRHNGLWMLLEVLSKDSAQDTTTEWCYGTDEQSLNERARCLRLNVGLPKHFWAEAINMACYLINRSPRASLAGKVIEELWTGHDDYSLARDRVRRTNIKPPSILGFEDLVSFALTVSSDDPVTFHDTVTSQENDKWMAAMVEEMESLNHNRTWELVPLPEGKKSIGCKWVYKKKPAVTEKEGEKHILIRAVLALVASWDLHLEHMDVKTAFLHGDLEEQIYMRQPEGFTQLGNEHLVCRLKKSLYGLKQSPRQWYKWFDSYMIKIGYNRCAAKKILGMEICRDRDSRKLWLSQRGYVEKMLERYGKGFVFYVVGCLMYAMVCTRPDLAHDVSQVCKYMSKPGKQHWEAVKWIFQYVKGTVGHGIVFGSQRDNPLVVGYVDSYYAGDFDNRRSTTGSIHLAKNQVYRARTKHIDVRFHKIRELVASGEVLFQKVHTDENVADMFTKPDIHQGGDLIGMAHKYTSKEDRGWSGTKDCEVKTTHVFQEGNQTVDRLVKMNLTGIGHLYRFTTPVELRNSWTLKDALVIILGTEILVVVKGTHYVGFVTFNPENRLIAKILYFGDVFVFPIGLIHFQFNIGNTLTVAIAGLSSKNAVVITIANALSGSNQPINPDILTRAFQLDKNVVTHLQSLF
ncbi:Germin-like protein subfamily 1 member 17 [Hibiscus syriacus]|uniref:Germin-like protein subfamily 1 member 17 n=1 Tax=Hibiscus syriacus TaxID=106335 RepID=A0A6A2WS14_HIBSY|nr:Germin-like protein subfamily 1 member 17 [Hibiscus syriacus]